MAPLPAGRVRGRWHDKLRPVQPQPPSRRLGDNARVYWRVQALVSWGVMALIAFSFAPQLPSGLDVAARVVALLALLGAVVIYPELRWRRWGYDLDDEEIDIAHGALWITRTLVPMRRVQHVEMSQGPLESQFRLATVTIYTAAGKHQIPALGAGAAGELRRRIAELARTADDL
jgi:membrane protein YdbS with pleckstrin-like domain